MATTKRTAKLANPRKAPRTFRQLDQQTATIDTQAINTNNQEITGEATPPRGFEAPLPEGLNSKIPSRGTPSTVTTTDEERETLLNNKLGRIDRSAAIKGRLGKDETRDGGRLQESIKTDDIPGFDQGFDQKPSGESLEVTVDNAGRTPMDPFRGGSMGGPLGAAAAAGIKTLADMENDGLISIQSDDAAKAGKAASALSGGAALVELLTASTTDATIKGIVEVGRLGFSSSFLTPGLTVAGSPQPF